jgi:hypothetical protein
MVYVPPVYGAPIQAPAPVAAALSPDETLLLQQIVGSFLWYARVIDCTMLPAVNAIGSELADGTISLLAAADRLLAYAAAFPANEIVYTACDMILHIQSDASYLSRSKARSVVGGHFCLGNIDQPTSINGPLLCISSTMNVVVASTSEAEYGALFTNAGSGVWIRTILEACWLPPAAHYHPV